MLIQSFDVDKVAVPGREGYYVLQHVGRHVDEIVMSTVLPTGSFEYTRYTPYRLHNGNVLISFMNVQKDFSDYNLVATDSTGAEEVVNLQIFERIKEYYDLPTDSSKGSFIFDNSVNSGDLIANRCDFSKYGPIEFAKNDELTESLMSDVSEIIVYEPILSVNSVAHLIYIYGTSEAELGQFLVNEDEFPRSARTLFESLKQVVEWADCVEDPWNNTETIAVKARQFLDQIGFDSEMLGHIRSSQKDMQIVRYLQGDTNARNRPAAPVEITNEIKLFIEKKVSHLCLSYLLSLFPGAVDCLEEIRARENDKVQKMQSAIINEYGLDMEYFYIDSVDEIIAAIQELKTTVPIPTIMRVRTLAIQREILDNANATS